MDLHGARDDVGLGLFNGGSHVSGDEVLVVLVHGVTHAILGQAEPGKQGRRIAVLGDMRELGPAALELHAGLAADLIAARIDSVFLAGPLMLALHDALPATLRGGYAETAADLEPMVAGGIERGDVIMVKGSNASRMGRLVDSLKTKFAVEADGDATQDVA